jgi:hypothetical protein
VKDWQLLSRGRLDVTRRTRLYGEIGKSQVQEGARAISITDVTAGVSKMGFRWPLDFMLTNDAIPTPFAFFFLCQLL